MEEEPIKSRLFQAELTPTDVKIFESPSNQPRMNPKNCAAVSAQLLGIVSKGVSESITAQYNATHIGEWVKELNRLSGAEVYSYELQHIHELKHELFLGFATLVLVTRLNGPGHFVVIAQDSHHNLYIIDPQAKLVSKNEEIEAYLKQFTLTDIVYVIKTPPRTKNEHISAYINDVLSARLSQCRIGGKRSTRKRNTRLRRKRIRRTRKQ